MRRKIKYSLITIALNVFLLSGCSTLITQVNDHSKDKIFYGFFVPRVYSGTVVDAHGITADNLGLFALIDLPLSFALDTVLLPYTIFRQIRLGNIESKNNGNENQQNTSSGNVSESGNK